MFRPYTLRARELLNREGLVIRFHDPEAYKSYPHVQVVQGIITHTDATTNGSSKYDHILVCLGPYETYDLPDEHLVEVVGEVAHTAVSYINHPNSFQPTEE